MSEKIKTATKAQWAQVHEVQDRWISRQTEQSSDSDMRSTIVKMYAAMGKKPPIILIAPSPFSAILWFALLCRKNTQPYTQLNDQLHDQLDTQLNTQPYTQLNDQLHDQLHDQLDTQLNAQLGKMRSASPYNSNWWQAWAGWYEGAQAIGVKFDEEKYQLFMSWCSHVTFCVPFDGLCITSRRPTSISWQGQQLHNESGPAVCWADGFHIWSIGGVRVNEQIVMRPETQTIYDISKEKNEEIRRIRIDRWGWMRYLEESKSTVVEQGRNDIECTYEILVDTPLGQRLITHCPSTGRRYSLAIPGEKVKTREAAQCRLWGDRNMTILGRT